MTEGLVCPLMTMGSDFLERCNGAQCAWWDCSNRCCGAIRPPERFELTLKGWAEVERIQAERNVRELAEYLS